MMDSAWRPLCGLSGPAKGREAGEAQGGFWPDAITHICSGSRLARKRWYTSMSSCVRSDSATPCYRRHRSSSRSTSWR